MPERHAGSDSGSSSSSGGSSSSGRSSSSSSSSSWSRREYRSGDSNGQGSWIGLALLGGVVLILLVGQSLANFKKSQADNDATATTQAITERDLAEMHAALDARIPVWERTTDKVIHRLGYSDAGFKADSNTKEVDYGYCDDGYFYVYVLENSQPETFMADTEGYAYVDSSKGNFPYSPRYCHPDNWTVVSVDNAAQDWYFVTLSTESATNAVPTLQMPFATSTPGDF